MIDSLFLSEAAGELRRYKDFAEKALAQVSDEAFFQQLDPESNSITVLVKHLAGNMRYMMTDFLGTIGENPNRDRDGEFVMEKTDDRGNLMDSWNEGWRLTFSTVEQLRPSDLEKEVRIKGTPQPVVRLINGQIPHIAFHVGQIVLLAKYHVRGSWQTLTTPRNRARLSTR